MTSCHQHPHYQVQTVLDRRVKCRVEYYVKWKHYTLQQCTWEPLHNLRPALRHLLKFESTARQTMEERRRRRAEISDRLGRPKERKEWVRKEEDLRVRPPRRDKKVNLSIGERETVIISDEEDEKEDVKSQRGREEGGRGKERGNNWLIDLSREQYEMCVGMEQNIRSMMREEKDKEEGQSCHGQILLEQSAEEQSDQEVKESREKARDEDRQKIAARNQCEKQIECPRHPRSKQQQSKVDQQQRSKAREKWLQEESRIAKLRHLRRQMKEREKRERNRQNESYQESERRRERKREYEASRPKQKIECFEILHEDGTIDRLTKDEILQRYPKRFEEHLKMQQNKIESKERDQ